MGGQPPAGLRLVPREDSPGFMLTLCLSDVLLCFPCPWQTEVDRVPFWHTLSAGALSFLTFAKIEGSPLGAIRPSLVPSPRREFCSLYTDPPSRKPVRHAQTESTEIMSRVLPSSGKDTRATKSLETSLHCVTVDL